MRISIIALLLTGMAAVSANAETFTGATNSTVTGSNSFSVPDGKPVATLNASFTGSVVSAWGKSAATKRNCTEWTTPPASTFQTNMVCNYRDNSGDTVAILAGCDFTNKDMSESDCWGGLQSTTGPHANKTGAISWHTKLSSDGKAAVSDIVGQWN